MMFSEPASLNLCPLVLWYATVLYFLFSRLLYICCRLTNCIFRADITNLISVFSTYCQYFWGKNDVLLVLVSSHIHTPTHAPLWSLTAHTLACPAPPLSVSLSVSTLLMFSFRACFINGPKTCVLDIFLSTYFIFSATGLHVDQAH